jgi:hypothetical protein
MFLRSEHWQWRQRTPAIESFDPLHHRLSQGLKLQAAEFRRIASEIAQCTRQQRTSAYRVLFRMMMKGDRRLNQGLEEFSFRLRRVSPSVFEDFVTFEKFRPIEERNSSRVLT